MSGTVDLSRPRQVVRSAVLRTAPPRLRAAGDTVGEALESGKAQAANGGPTVALMAFGLEVKTTQTQRLFFKSLAHEATLHHGSFQVSINTPLPEALRPDLSEPLQEPSRGYIRRLPSELLKPAA